MRLPIATGWFDFVAVAFVIFGAVLGKRRGVSLELIPFLQWLTIIAICGSFNRPLGEPFARWAEINPSTSCALVYLTLLCVLSGIFYCLRVAVGEKLMMKDLFGQAEYYLGMVAGGVRYFCILLAFMAILNAKYVTEQELRDMEALQAENFGAVRLPTMATIQRDIFMGSATGRYTKYYLSGRLVLAQAPVSYEKKRIEGFGKKMEKSIDEAIDETERQKQGR